VSLNTKTVPKSKRFSLLSETFATLHFPGAPVGTPATKNKFRVERISRSRYLLLEEGVVPQCGLCSRPAAPGPGDMPNMCMPSYRIAPGVIMMAPICRACFNEQVAKKKAARIRKGQAA
jgi:hypothetical protein